MTNTRTFPKELPTSQQPESPPLIPLSQLQPGNFISGHVVRLLPYGALIQTSYNIPGKTPGCVLLHNAQLPEKGGGGSLLEPLQVGQFLPRAKVISVNRGTNQVQVSLLQENENGGHDSSSSNKIPFGAIRLGDEFLGRVTKIHEYGAFVDIGTKRDALLHKSRISSDFVDNVNDCLQVGDTAVVRVIHTSKKDNESNNNKKNLAVSMLSPTQDVMKEQQEQLRRITGYRKDTSFNASHSTAAGAAAAAAAAAAAGTAVCKEKNKRDYYNDSRTFTTLLEDISQDMKTNP